MTEFILVVTEFYTPNTDAFAHRVSGNQLLWFRMLTYFTHTLISWACVEGARGRFVWRNKEHK